MLCKLYLNSYDYQFPEIDPEYFALDMLDSVEDGVVVRKSTVKSISVAKTYDGFTCHDFDISTIISTGSEKMLRPVQFRNADMFSVVAGVDNLVKMFDSNEKAV